MRISPSVKRLLAALCVVMWPVVLWAEDIKLANGQTVSGTIKRVEPDGLVVETANGVEKMDFLALSEDVRKQYNFDFEKAQAYRAQQAAARRAMVQQQIAALREKSAVLEEKQKEAQPTEQDDRKLRLVQSSFVAGGTVIRGTSAGSIVSLGMNVGRAAHHMLEKDTRAVVSLGDGFVYGLDAADGETWQGTLFPAGYFRFTDKYGDEHTIRAYALTVEDALARGGDARSVVPNPSIAAPGVDLPGNLRGGTMLDRRR